MGGILGRAGSAVVHGRTGELDGEWQRTGGGTGAWVWLRIPRLSAIINSGRANRDKGLAFKFIDSESVGVEFARRPDIGGQTCGRSGSFLQGLLGCKGRLIEA
jgi:hypothetical protein